VHYFSSLLEKARAHDSCVYTQHHKLISKLHSIIHVLAKRIYVHDSMRHAESGRRRALIYGGLAHKSLSTNLLGTPACITPTKWIGGTKQQHFSGAEPRLDAGFRQLRRALCFAPMERRDCESEREIEWRRRNSLAVQRAHTHTLLAERSDAFCAPKVCGGALDFQSDPLRHASNSKKSLTSPQSVARACTGLFFYVYTQIVFGAAQVNSSLLSSCGRLTCELNSNKIAWGVACDL
jgi:hypothetical protein